MFHHRLIVYAYRETHTNKRTESRRIFEALKSRYITGFSAPCKKARPLAAPILIFNLVPHGNEIDIPASLFHSTILTLLISQILKTHTHICNILEPPTLSKLIPEYYHISKKEKRICILLKR